MALAGNIPHLKTVLSVHKWVFCLSAKVKCIVLTHLGSSVRCCILTGKERKRIWFSHSVIWKSFFLCTETRVLQDTGPPVWHPAWGSQEGEWLALLRPYRCLLGIQTFTSCPMGCQWDGPKSFSARLVSLNFTESAKRSFIIWKLSSWMYCQEVTGKSPSTSVSEPRTGLHCWELQGLKILGIALRSAWERALHPSVENNVRTASYPLSHNVCSGPQRVSRLRAQMTT